MKCPHCGFTVLADYVPAHLCGEEGVVAETDVEVEVGGALNTRALLAILVEVMAISGEIAALRGDIASLKRAVRRIARKESEMSQGMDALVQTVNDAVGVEQSALVLINGLDTRLADLQQQLTDAGVDAAKVMQMRNDLAAATAPLAAAVAANNPAPPPPVVPAGDGGSGTPTGDGGGVTGGTDPSSGGGQ